jgi:hypothetical protein
MSLQLHVRRAHRQRDHRANRGMPRGTNLRSIRDFALQKEQ